MYRSVFHYSENSVRNSEIIINFRLMYRSIFHYSENSVRNSACVYHSIRPIRSEPDKTGQLDELGFSRRCHLPASEVRHTNQTLKKQEAKFLPKFSE